MRDNNQKIHIPFLLLDLIGTLVVAMAAMEMANLFHIVPPSLQFENYPVVMAATGFVLMLPFITWSVKRTFNNAKNKESK